MGTRIPTLAEALGIPPYKPKRRRPRGVRRAKLVEELVRRDGQLCAICRSYMPLRDRTLDHIVPFSMDGPNTVENLRLTHAECNSLRGNTPLEPDNGAL